MRLLAAALVVLATASGCSQQAGPAPQTASPAPSIVLRSAPADLLAGHADLPVGYALAGDESATEFVAGDGRAISGEELRRIGFTGGHVRTFRLDAEAANRDRITYVYVYVFADGAAAAAALESAVPKDPSYRRVALGETFGDNSHGYRFTGAAGGQQVEVHMIHFQYGNSVSFILVQSPPSTAAMGEAAAVARAQLAAVRADAPASARTTPAPRTSPITRAPSDLPLRLDDLPQGFAVTDDSTVGIDDLADGALNESFWRSIGLRDGWGRIFATADQSTSITSVVLLCSATRAEAALRTMVEDAKTDDLYEISLGERFGDESVALEARAASASTRLTARVVFLRYGDAVAWISMRSPGGAVEASFLGELARRLLARMR